MGVNDNEVFWEDLLSHIRQQVLIPVVGPDLTVVNVGDAEQTLTTIVGQRLAERYQLTVPPGATSNRQYLWIKIFYAASSVAVVSSGRSTSLPFSNFAPARTSATRWGALTARQRDWAASISL